MPGARTKRIARIREALPFAVELADLSSEMDSNWMTRRTGRSEDDSIWLPLPVSHCPNMDDPRAVSNYRVAERMLGEVSPFGTDYRIDLWPGGKIYTLMIRADDAAAIRAAENIVATLEGFGVLDDEDLRDAEWDANHPNDSECYADDEDECLCDVAVQRREAAYHETVGHVQICHENQITPELDADSEWFCRICDSWIYFSPQDIRDLARAAYVRECREAENTGQLTIDAV